MSMALSTPSTGGTCRWMAPELLKSDDADGVPQKPSKESDVYSFGMVAYEVSPVITSPPSRTEGFPDLRTLSTFQTPQLGLLGPSRRHRWETASTTTASGGTRTRRLGVGHDTRVLGFGPTKSARYQGCAKISRTGILEVDPSHARRNR